MRRTTQLFGVLGLVLLLAACSEPHFMTDTSYRRRGGAGFSAKAGFDDARRLFLDIQLGSAGLRT